MYVFIKPYVFIALLAVSFAGCSSQRIKPEPPSPPAAQPSPVQIPEVSRPDAAARPAEPVKTTDFSVLKPSDWEEIDGFKQDDLSQAWAAWQQSCGTLKNRAEWQRACAAAAKLADPDSKALQAYFRQYFNVYQATNPDGTDTGLITGYYQPMLKGSRQKSTAYPYPVYSKPDDLITVELSSVFPELVNKRVRGRLTENKLVPYFNRAEIEVEPSPLQGRELLWVDDIIDLFFLQIQGSGIVQLENGEKVHVGYADQNGHAYQSIGRLLIERGELTLEKASMQGIKDWARNNLDKLRELLNSNPSYVFFRELPGGLPGPLGALGVPIMAERSVAIDPRHIPLGAPLFLSTTYPNNAKPLKRMMIAQDTGGAIKGGVRADFYWGAGYEAGRQAGAMKQPGKIWVLLPKEMPIP
ncbi:membrane-bound lytic murein transglycosylase A [Methylophilaceae bacterium]|nr:membrane-bound lytic murein transglycosylase A [Methylophilaceae bacterium]